MKEEEQEHLLRIREALEQKEGLSFQYRRPDGQVIRHNAVYPREIYSDEQHTYFRAYCHFTRDVRSFRLDRVQSLQRVPKKEPLTLRDYIGVVVVILLLPASYAGWTVTGGDPRGEWVLVTYITDGDTIGVGRGWRYQKVRLLGVDTPEVVHPSKPVEPFGPEASEFTARTLKGQRVRLEFEPANQYDRYDRLLAYVVLADGTLFNAELVKQGYARVIAPSPFRYYEEFKSYEREAREAGVGIWSRK
jgi:endonuclease YncB( thermonuclease family)